MSKLPAKPIPESYRRIVLVNPTKYLGNLLIAGGLIQDFYQYCLQRGIEFRLVVDENFRELLHGALPEEVFIYYPRRRIADAGNLDKARLYLGCVKRIRALQADIAFNIEEDTVSHRLALLSGARFKLGCSITRHGRGYDHVLPVVFSERSETEKHRWHGFKQSFRALGMNGSHPGYLRLESGAWISSVRTKLTGAGIDPDQPLIAIHAGATKDFKRWPAICFVRLIELLQRRGCQVALIGAGQSDRAINWNIQRMLADRPAHPHAFELCDRFTLAELAAFFTQVTAVIGNDSGPFHLAAAVGAPGCVIFGPTEVALWRPLAQHTVALSGDKPCAPECTKTGCIYNHRCLKSITPDMVMDKLSTVTSIS